MDEYEGKGRRTENRRELFYGDFEPCFSSELMKVRLMEAGCRGGRVFPMTGNGASLPARRPLLVPLIKKCVERCLAMGARRIASIRPFAVKARPEASVPYLAGDRAYRVLAMTRDELMVVNDRNRIVWVARDDVRYAGIEPA